MEWLTWVLEIERAYLKNQHLIDDKEAKEKEDRQSHFSSGQFLMGLGSFLNISARPDEKDGHDP